MKTAVSRLLFLSTAWGSASVVMAHPGHGQNGGSFSLFHYLSEPVHLGVGLALIGLVAAGVYWLKRNAPRKNTPGNPKNR